MTPLSARRLTFVAACLLVPAGGARAQGDPSTPEMPATAAVTATPASPTAIVNAAPAEAAPPPPATAARLLDRAIHDEARARKLYRRILSEYPDTPQAAEARQRLERLSPAPPPPPPEPAAPPPVATAPFDYSPITRERLSINTLEKLDFSSTLFFYGALIGGLSIGSLSADGASAAAGGIVGGLGYLGFGLFMLDDPARDRGDLPLMLSIAQFPPGVALALLAAGNVEDPQIFGSVLLGTAMASLATASYVGNRAHVDPGDAQLIRDAGFWATYFGLGAAIVAGDGDFTDRGYALVSVASLASGLALGGAASTFSEFSYERIRVATWGGYAGTAAGLLFAAALSSSGENNSGRFIMGTTMAGTLLGLTVGLGATGAIDEPPPGATARRIEFATPTLLAAQDDRGRYFMAPGLSLVRGEW